MTGSPTPSAYRARLMRVVISVDPAASASENSDLTGIIVAGLGWDRCAYVLDDLTGRYSPDAWGRRVVSAYHAFEADRVVIELNMGGAMCEHVIRTVDPRVAIKGVRATRGKAIRAEPVAALYEQGRVFHVRPFVELEDQLCQFNPADPPKKSPDRMDALVWALTALMLESTYVRRNLDNLPPG